MILNWKIIWKNLHRRRVRKFGGDSLYLPTDDKVAIQKLVEKRLPKTVYILVDDRDCEAKFFYF
jgi:hypothetical protein